MQATDSLHYYRFVGACSPIDSGTVALVVVDNDLVGGLVVAVADFPRCYS